MHRRWLSVMLMGLLWSSAHAVPPSVVAGTSAAIEVPPGFQQIVPFELDSPADHATISVTELPSPFSMLRAQMNDHGKLAKRDVKVLRSEKVNVSGHEGLLQLERRGRGHDVKEAWRLGMGDMLSSLTVDAIYPVNAPGSLSDELRKALLTVVWHKEEPDAKFVGLHFRVKESTFLKIAEHGASGLLLRPDESPIRDPAPILVMGEMPMAGGELQDVSGQLLHKTKELQEIANVHGERLKIARLDAYEITADARRSGDRTAERIYQLVVYDPAPQRAYVAVGVVGEVNAKRYMREFQDVARSLTPKP